MAPRKPKDATADALGATLAHNGLGAIITGVTESDDSAAVDPIAALTQAADIGLPWAEMRNNLQAVIESVARGSVKATAAQVAMLKHIVAEAKEATKGDEGVIGVVILPTQGAAASLQISAAAKKRALEAIRGQA